MGGRMGERRGERARLEKRRTGKGVGQRQQTHNASLTPALPCILSSVRGKKRDAQLTIIQYTASHYVLGNERVK